MWAAFRDWEKCRVAELQLTSEQRARLPDPTFPPGPRAIIAAAVASDVQAGAAAVAVSRKRVATGATKERAAAVAGAAPCKKRPANCK